MCAALLCHLNVNQYIEASSELLNNTACWRVDIVYRDRAEDWVLVTRSLVEEEVCGLD